jgi:hypothetical protein
LSRLSWYHLEACRQFEPARVWGLRIDERGAWLTIELPADVPDVGTAAAVLFGRTEQTLAWRAVIVSEGPAAKLRAFVERMAAERRVPGS